VIGNLAKIRAASARQAAPSGGVALTAQAVEPSSSSSSSSSHGVLAADTAPGADVGDGMGCTLPFNRALVMLEVLHLLGPQVRLEKREALHSEG
jgi:hypothetical protein